MEGRKKIALLLVGVLFFGGCEDKIRSEKREEKRDIENIAGIDFILLEIKNGLYFEKGKKEPFTGTALEKYKSGKVRVVREFVTGKINGKITTYYETGETAEITYYENNIPVGESVLFQKITRKYEEGAIKEQIYYHTNGYIGNKTPMLPDWRAHGIQEHYWWTGEAQLQSKIPHKNGKRHGIAEYYKQDGTLEKTENYIDGQLQK